MDMKTPTVQLDIYAVNIYSFIYLYYAYDI